MRHRCQPPAATVIILVEQSYRQHLLVNRMKRFKRQNKLKLLRCTVTTYAS